MRLSQLFARTLRDDPADAETASHRLLVRAGFIRRVAAGVYSQLPLGLRVLRSVERVVREEMDAAGAQEVALPDLLPREPWDLTGRWEAYGDLMFRLVDRRGAEFCLGPTHEELITGHVADELSSYRDLPVNLYQIGTKYRDELRPRSGLIRARSFVMKDAYSFHADRDSLRETYEAMHAAYVRIFERCGLDVAAVEAQAGEIGGDVNHEFMAPSPIGEDRFVRSPSGSYAANVEAATTADPGRVEPGDAPLTRVATPGASTVAQVAEALGVPTSQVLKCLLMDVERDDAPGERLAVLAPGDREVSETKLAAAVGGRPRLLTDEDLAAEPRLVAGFVGPQGLAGLVDRIVADRWVLAGRDWVAGANEPDAHVTGCQLGRDVTPDEVADVTEARPGDPSPHGDGPLEEARAIEVGHIFQLGTRYSEPLGATFLDPDGAEHPMLMGCYGIGVSRVVAAVVEQRHDDDGIRWPTELAPFACHLVPLGRGVDWSAVDDVAGRLRAAGLQVLVDDRDASAGVKLADADLIGCPVRVVAGRRLGEGVVEVRARGEQEPVEVDLDRLVDAVGERLARA